MTLDEAIEFSKYKATQQYDELQKYEYDAEEHEQLAEWLENYKKFLKFQKNCTFDNKVYCYGFDEGYKKGRADAIDEVLKALSKKGAEITFDLPVEEVLGEDIDIDDFFMLVQDVIQAYRKLVIGTILQLKEQKNDWLDKIAEQLKEQE